MHIDIEIEIEIETEIMERGEVSEGRVHRRVARVREPDSIILLLLLLLSL